MAIWCQNDLDADTENDDDLDENTENDVDQLKILKITGISPVHLTRGWLWPRGGAPSGDLVVTMVRVVIVVSMVRVVTDVY